MDALLATPPVFRMLGGLLTGLPGGLHTCLQAIGSANSSFCVDCRSALETDRFAACWRCGSTIGPHEEVMDGCSRCRKTSFHFSRVFRLGTYEGLLREVVLRMKSQAGESLAWSMGELFAAMPPACSHGASTRGRCSASLATTPSRVQPVRGTGPGTLLASSLSSGCGLARSRHTEQQVGSRQPATAEPTSLIPFGGSPQGFEERGSCSLTTF